VFERQALERLMPVVEGLVMGSSRMSASALRTIAKHGPIVMNRELRDVSPSPTIPVGYGPRVGHLRGCLGHEDIT
jgi:hypothetical protein